jgi:uncharacterized membrane protein YhaH (DUF805 family)
MNFFDAIKTCLRKYADFGGTASRSEYWWFYLFTLLGSLVLGALSSTLGGVFSLLVLLPSLAAGARRLHDTDRSGWLQLLYFIPFIGWIILIVMLAQDSRPNRFAAPAIVHGDIV